MLQMQSESEQDGQTEGDDTQELRRSALSVSPQISSLAPSEDRSGNESFSQKMRLRVSFLLLGWPPTVLQLGGFVCLFVPLAAARDL